MLSLIMTINFCTLVYQIFAAEAFKSVTTVSPAKIVINYNTASESKVGSL